MRVYIPSSSTAGNRTIQLVDATGVVLQEMVVNLGIGEHVVELNFDVPIGNDLSLRNTENNLARNNSGVDYPYPIGDMGEITTSLIGDGFYYYFYDWKVQKASFECISDRVPVNVNVTDAHEVFTQAGFSIFPNPTSDRLFVKMENPAESLTLLDAQGKIIESKKTIGNETITLKTNELSAGLYFIRITAEGQLFHSKFVKE